MGSRGSKCSTRGMQLMSLSLQGCSLEDSHTAPKCTREVHAVPSLNPMALPAAMAVWLGRPAVRN